MLSKKFIEEYKRIYKKEFGKEISDQEALEQGTRLVNFFEILHKINVKEKIRKKKLKQHPKGFHLPESEIYNCCICGDSVQGKTSWYDKNGIKCLLCQKALDQGIIPAKVCHDRDIWYAMWQLKDKFGFHYQTVKKMIRLGELKARIVLDNNNKPYFYVFLKEENKDALFNKIN